MPMTLRISFGIPPGPAALDPPPTAAPPRGAPPAPPSSDAAARAAASWSTCLPRAVTDNGWWLALLGGLVVPSGVGDETPGDFFECSGALDVLLWLFSEISRDPSSAS